MAYDMAEKVLEQADIYAVISGYISLTQKSNRYWGVCPFHKEKTASLCVSADKGFFYCFGCGAGGNVIKFVSLIEGISYGEAINVLAERLGIKREGSKKENNLLKANESAQEYYQKCLLTTKQGYECRKYLEGRGLGAEEIKEYGLGYAPEEWEGLQKELKDYSGEELTRAGLVIKRKSGTGYYDVFRGRLMIPIRDEYGQVLGFGGRVIGEGEPKYLNTAETEIFNKRRTLYGLDKAKNAIRKSGAAIMVEGYMDAISLQSKGIKNVVATLGTALTSDHAQQLRKYTDKIIICYDSDGAGQKATERAIPIMRKSGAEVYVSSVPEGKDPDEYIRKEGAEKFRQLMSRAQSVLDYNLKKVRERADITTRQGKLRALNEIMSMTEKIDDAITRNEYEQKISAALTLDEETVRREWNRYERTGRKAIKVRAEESKTEMAKMTVLQVMISDREVIEYVKMMVPSEMFTSEEQEIIEWLEKNKSRDVNSEELSEGARSKIARAMINNECEVKEFKDSLDTLRCIWLKGRYESLMQKAKEKPEDMSYIKESLQIKKEMDRLKSEGGQ
ncbi:MAG: DNA primase [Selenomonadaceae bacterium]|nr:DNA primase [Selenomonadaceae bacterium]